MLKCHPIAFKTTRIRVRFHRNREGVTCRGLRIRFRRRYTHRVRTHQRTGQYRAFHFAVVRFQGIAANRPFGNVHQIRNINRQTVFPVIVQRCAFLLGDG